MRFVPLLSFVSLLSTGGFTQAQTASQAKHTGELFIFVPGLGACGFTNSSSQIVASVPRTVFQNFPGAGGNPNENPICHHQVAINHNGTSLMAHIVDFFTDASPGANGNVGLSLPGFKKFAPESKGRLPGVTWVID